MGHHACREDGDLRDHYIRLRNRGMHHFPAMTAVALKLARVVWRILTDRRDYQPRHPES